jgi:hypothetical protein
MKGSKASTQTDYLLNKTRLSLPKMLSGANTFEISDHQFKPR